MPTDIIDYGTPEQPNLEGISATVGKWVYYYENMLQLSLIDLGVSGDFQIASEVNLTLTPEKSTTARTVLEVNHHGTKIGDCDSVAVK